MNHVLDWGDDEEKAVYAGLEMAEERKNPKCFGQYGQPNSAYCTGCHVLNHCKLSTPGMFSDHAKAMSEAKQKQVGGDHYKTMTIQPVEYIHANNMNFLQGSVIKYISRYKAKNGKQDLEKAKHFIDLLIELEYK